MNNEVVKCDCGQSYDYRDRYKHVHTRDHRKFLRIQRLEYVRLTLLADNEDNSNLVRKIEAEIDRIRDIN